MKHEKPSRSEVTVDGFGLPALELRRNDNHSSSFAEKVKLCRAVLSEHSDHTDRLGQERISHKQEFRGSNIASPGTPVFSRHSVHSIVIEKYKSPSQFFDVVEIGVSRSTRVPPLIRHERLQRD